MVNAVKLFRYLIASPSDLAPFAPILLDLFHIKRIFGGFKNNKYYKSMVNAVKLFRCLIASPSDLAP